MGSVNLVSVHPMTTCWPPSLKKKKQSKKKPFSFTWVSTAGEEKCFTWIIHYSESLNSPAVALKYSTFVVRVTSGPLFLCCFCSSIANTRFLTEPFSEHTETVLGGEKTKHCQCDVCLSGRVKMQFIAATS